MAGPKRRGGFKRAATLVQSRIRSAGESRGFAVSRLLTHWPDIVGPDIARAARPVEVTYGRGIGATLTILTTGAEAPMLEMQKETIRERVNACYGYAAISRVRLTQTAATGFSEGRADFDHAPKAPQQDIVPEAVQQKANAAASGVSDPSLRSALERLGTHILSDTKQQ